MSLLYSIFPDAALAAVANVVTVKISSNIFMIAIHLLYYLSVTVADKKHNLFSRPSTKHYGSVFCSDYVSTTNKELMEISYYLYAARCNRQQTAEFYYSDQTKEK